LRRRTQRRGIQYTAIIHALRANWSRECAQGFAFGKPMEADASMRLLTGERLETAS
jgi:hypothetical protein